VGAFFVTNHEGDFDRFQKRSKKLRFIFAVTNIIPIFAK
jgi:hypothetical protein